MDWGHCSEKPWDEQNGKPFETNMAALIKRKVKIKTKSIPKANYVWLKQQSNICSQTCRLGVHLKPQFNYIFVHLFVDMVVNCSQFGLTKQQN